MKIKTTSAVDSSIVSLDELVSGMNQLFNLQGCALLAGRRHSNK